MTAASMRKLRFSYAGGEVLFDDFDLAVPEGRITVLIGPNGSGKSTLLSLLLGYLLPSAGEIELFGRPLTSWSRQQLGRSIGFVSQTDRLPFNYEARDYILLGRSARIALMGSPGKDDRAAAERAAEVASIGDLLDRNVQEISTGELQLVSIARALAQEPRLLLLDEPTSHLDPANAVRVFRLMRSLSTAGMTILFTTHDPLHARQAAEEALLLGKGRLLFAGPVEEGLSARRLGELYGVEFQEADFRGKRIPFLEV